MIEIPILPTGWRFGGLAGRVRISKLNGTWGLVSNPKPYTIGLNYLKLPSVMPRIGGLRLNLPTDLTVTVTNSKIKNGFGERA
jgi:hypothetical protein